jgi:anti-sigma regulatory factor (Ser/Thr protein kinase)
VISGDPPADAPLAAVFRMDLPCALTQVRPAAARALAFLAAQGCASDDLSACELALVEACNNAVRYAPPERRDLPVFLEIICDPGAIEMRVTDHTGGFDWPEPVALPAQESESGRGLYLIRTLMHSARYFQGKGENLLILRRFRKPGRAGVPEKIEPSAASADCQRRLAESEEVVGQMLEELSSCYESLAAIFRYGAEQAKAGQLEDFARRLLGDMLRILKADWFVVRIAPEGES